MSTQPAETTPSDDLIRMVKGRGVNAVAEPAIDPDGCPRCDGSGRQVQQAENGAITVRPCDCQRQREAARLFNAAELPRILGSRTLVPRSKARRDPDTFLVRNDRMGQVLGRVQEFVDQWPQNRGNGRGFLLTGPSGTGKSHLLVAALRGLVLEHRTECRYVEFFHLLSELKEGYSRGKSDTELIEPLCDVEVLAVDELGKGRGTAWELYVLDEVISRRYNAGKSTLFASNYTQKKDTTLRERVASKRGLVNTSGLGDELLQETLEERLGSRIYSRLCEMCDFYETTGEDYRQTPDTTIY